MAHAAANPMYDDDVLEEEDDKSAEQEFVDSLDAARRCLTCFNAILLLLGGALTALAIVGGDLVITMQWLPNAIAIVAGTIFVVTVLGCIGANRSHASKILSIYYTLLVFGTFGLLVLGGFCFILTDTAADAVRNNWDGIIADLPADQRAGLDKEEALAQLQLYLYATGAVAWLLMLLLMAAMSNVVRLVTKLQAATILLQATNLALLPLGVALIAGALFIADTAATVEAPYAAFAIFIMGVLLLTLNTIGCIGVSLHSRGIIRIFMFFVFFLALLMTVFGALALGQASTVQEELTNRWDTIRRVLPPTFSGKFDKTQFERFVKENLQMLGFASLCGGLLLAVMWWMAIRIRVELKKRTRMEQELDQLHDELKEGLQDVEGAVRNLKAARRALRSEMDREASDAHERTVTRTEIQRYVRLCEAVDAGEMDPEALVANPPRAANETSDALYQLHIAVYHRVRARMYLAEIEDRIDEKEGTRRRRDGVRGLKRKSLVGASASGEMTGNTLKDRMSASGRHLTATEAVTHHIMTNREDGDLVVRDRPVRYTNPVQLCWKQSWTHGSKRSRRCVGLVCCCCCCIVLGVIALASVALYFSIMCSDLGSGVDPHVYPASGASSFYLMHNSTRGEVSVVVDAEARDTTVTLEQRAFKEDFASNDVPEIVRPADNSSATLLVPFKPPTRVMEYDISCQVVNINVMMPHSTDNSAAAAVAADSTGSPTVEAHLGGDYAGFAIRHGDVMDLDKPRFHRLDVSTSGGPIEAYGALLGGDGAALTTNAGDVLFDNVDAQCDPLRLGQDGYGINIRTSKGSIQLEHSDFSNCDIQASGDAALIRILDSTVTNTRGGGRFAVAAEKGLVEVRDSIIGVLDVRGNDGTVRGSNATILDEARIATLGGEVSFSSMRMGPRGVLQIETGAGAVGIHLSQFAGIVSIVTGGEVSCSGDGFDRPYNTGAGNFVPCVPDSGRSDDLKVVERVSVNCAFGAGTHRDNCESGQAGMGAIGCAALDDCAYLGELSLTSASGSVTVTADRWDRQ